MAAYLNFTGILSREISLVLLPSLLFISAIVIYIAGKMSLRSLLYVLYGAWCLLLLCATWITAEGLHSPFTSTLLWFNAGQPIEVTYGLDHPGTLMVALVILVTFLVSVYSTSYMKGEKGLPRYFASLFLFATAMLGIVLSFNLLLTFVFWELVGFCSYLLINFWYEKPSANAAAKKAFLLNRIGDLGFVMGLGLLYGEFKTFELDEIKILIAAGQFDKSHLFLAGLGIFFGCIGKSAQFPLLVWLPDAMQAPTPVSALLHAATMVAAGVFLMARVLPILSPDVLVFVAYTGALTALIGAFSAATQTDIKKILAYSTVSQLGYMIAALGAHSSFAALFHLFTHATFKATLFLAAGAIIHAMAHLRTSSLLPSFDPQDVRLMGGLRKKMPVTFVAFTLATLAGAGVPGSAGFLSKDEIFASVCSWAALQQNPMHWILPVLIFTTSFTTAYYLGRLYFMVFFGGFRLGNKYSEYRGHSLHLLEAPFPMLAAYLPLSFFSVFIIFSLHPFDPDQSWLIRFLPRSISAYGVEANFLEHLHAQGEKWHYSIICISLVVLTVGFLLSGALYGFRTRFKKEFLKRRLTSSGIVSLSYHALYLNVLYEKAFVRPFDWLALRLSRFDTYYVDKSVNMLGTAVVAISHFISWLDIYLVDGLVNACVYLVTYLGKQLRILQNGKVQSYLLVGIAIMFVTLIWVLIK